MFKVLNELDQETGLKVSQPELVAIIFLRSYTFLNTAECSQITMILKQAVLRAVSENESTLDKAEG